MAGTLALPKVAQAFKVLIGSSSLSASAYIVQTCTGDPLVETNWHHADTVGRSSGTLEGLASGKVFVRVCARGADAHKGAWSDLAEEMVR